MNLKNIVILGIVLAILTIATTANARHKWKGNWYLRGVSECKEITLDRKGKSELAIYPKAIVEKRGDDYYLTVESLGEKYTYRMINREDSKDYDLDLASTGPNQPLPPRSRLSQERFTGMFRKIADCQIVTPALSESSIYR